MKKKLLLVVVLLLSFILVLASCDSNDSTTNTDSTPENTTTHTHTYGDWIPKKTVTCTENGTKEKYCSCGEKITETVAATGHSFGEWTTTQEPTTTEKGLKERKCTCGEKETQDIDMLPPIPNTVTAAQWKKAFDLSGFDSFVLTINELCAEEADNEVYGRRGTITVENGIAYNDFVRFRNDEEKPKVGYASGLIESLSDFSTDWLCEFWFEIDDLSNYGYSMFTYSSDTDSYSASLEIDHVPCVATIAFNNAKILSITLTGRTSEYSINCTYTFAYN